VLAGPTGLTGAMLHPLPAQAGFPSLRHRPTPCATARIGPHAGLSFQALTLSHCDHSE